MRRLALVLVVWAAHVGLAAGPASAWSPQTQIAIGDGALSITPHDLRRQLVKHKKPFRQGLLAPFEGKKANDHVKNPDGSGTLDRTVATEVERAIDAIRNHKPFVEIVFQLGVVAHYVADAGNPLSATDADPSEPRYFADYLRYVESAQARFGVVFYGDGRQIGSPAELAELVDQSLDRGRALYPMIGREYRRIGRVAGVKEFDDRSTAFGVGALAFSHSVSDVAAVLRYVWLQAGGADGRNLPISPPATAEP